MNRKIKNQNDGRPRVGIFSTSQSTPGQAIESSSWVMHKARSIWVDLSSDRRILQRAGPRTIKTFFLEPTSQHSLADGI